jgi:hypothetical protein
MPLRQAAVASHFAAMHSCVGSSLGIAWEVPYSTGPDEATSALYKPMSGADIL